MLSDSPNGNEHAKLRQLGSLQSQLFTKQTSRHSALFYADHSAQSQQDFEDSMNQASDLERQCAALSEQHRALLQELRRRNPELVAWWAGTQAALFEELVEGMRTRGAEAGMGMEPHLAKEAAEHWRAIASGAKDGALDSLTQRGWPAQVREELARRLGLGEG